MTLVVFYTLGNICIWPLNSKIKLIKKRKMVNTIRKKVIVIGGGFAGIQFTKALDEKYFDVLLHLTHCKKTTFRKALT